MSGRLTRLDLDEAVLEFATDPKGVLTGPEAQGVMLCWYEGRLFPRTFNALYGCICKRAQDAGLTHEETQALLDTIFQPEAHRDTAPCP